MTSLATERCGQVTRPIVRCNTGWFPLPVKNPMRTAAILAILVMTSATRAADPPDLSGAWSGHWESQTSGHRGPLSATFHRANDTQYSVVFRGRFLKIIPFRYKTDLDITGYQDDTVLLAGSRKLLFFGTFSYSAEATGTDFTANYEARNDRGVFVMKRH